MRDKQKLFDVLDDLYDIIADSLKPSDKDVWKEDTWAKLQNKTDAEFDDYVNITSDIASLNIKKE
jgi:hypothetical protein